MACCQALFDHVPNYAKFLRGAHEPHYNRKKPLSVDMPVHDPAWRRLGLRLKHFEGEPDRIIEGMSATVSQRTLEIPRSVNEIIVDKEVSLAERGGIHKAYGSSWKECAENDTCSQQNDAE